MSKYISHPWTPEDEARLRTLATIAERLKRSKAAIRYKARRLDIALKRDVRGPKKQTTMNRARAAQQATPLDNKRTNLPPSQEKA
jgi:hypothetical protein